jgi:hypothetical protein
VARFDCEAKPLASLNHPKIAQACGLETTDGATTIVVVNHRIEELKRRVPAL